VRVYHFLPSKYALEDLQNRRLKIARFNEINDPFELAAATLRTRDERKVFAGYRQEMAGTYGILCFSRNWRNPVLWSHYAERHTGLCLGFDICDSLLMDIIYTETRITLTRGDRLRREDLTPQVAERLLSMKFRDWSYEDEVRVFVRLEERDSVTGLYFRKFDERIKLAEAIAGHGCTVKRTEIKQAIGNDPKVDIIKARLAFKSFWVVKNERGFASS